jgi:hypothetical protein
MCSAVQTEYMETGFPAVVSVYLLCGEVECTPANYQHKDSTRKIQDQSAFLILGSIAVIMIEKCG